MITYETANFSEIWDDVKDIVTLQWEGYDFRKTRVDLKVMEDWYKSAEESGMNYIIIAKDGEKIAGYISMFIMDNPHTGSLHAISDTLYVVSDYRNSGVGRGLIKASEEEGKNRGADYFSITLMNGHSHENLIQGLELNPYETVYSKALSLEEV